MNNIGAFVQNKGCSTVVHVCYFISVSLVVPQCQYRAVYFNMHGG